MIDDPCFQCKKRPCICATHPLALMDEEVIRGLRAEIDAVKAALRKCVIHPNNHKGESSGYFCNLCNDFTWRWSEEQPIPPHGFWHTGKAERHADGCLAALRPLPIQLTSKAKEDTGLQPIATAPYNERVLVFGKHDADGTTEEVALGWLDNVDDRWYYSPQGGLIHHWTPTHWMRLLVPDIAGVAEVTAVPDDWNYPHWAEYRKVHCWRNHVGEEVVGMWQTFTSAQKKALARRAEELASAEHWE